MRWVEDATMNPGRCAVTGRSDGPFLDTGATIATIEPRVYLSGPAVQQIADAAQFISHEQHAETLARVAELEKRCKELEEDLLEADKFAAAVDVLESRDFTARRKAGRPKKEAA